MVGPRPVEAIIWHVHPDCLAAVLAAEPVPDLGVYCWHPDCHRLERPCIHSAHLIAALNGWDIDLDEHALDPSAGGLFTVAVIRDPA